jgi:excisionase family DNA binding protein
MGDMMNTREVAAYLRIKERKVYDLVKTGKIPCTRVTGKWLFPKTVIDLWVIQNLSHKGDPAVVPAPPPIIAGSHDPLLDWAVRESGSGLALMFGGSLDGLRRFAAGDAIKSLMTVWKTSRFTAGRPDCAYRRSCGRSGIGSRHRPPTGRPESSRSG